MSVETAPLEIDSNSGDNLREVVETLPKPAMPLVIAGPWTREARWYAAQKDVKSAFQRYFTKAMKVRNWTPWDDLPLAEMADHGHKLSEDTVTIIEAYLGVEDYVGDYVLDGLNYLGPYPVRRDAHIAWGMEEVKHAAAWEAVLIHSGRRTERQIQQYREEISKHPWRFHEQFPEFEPILGVIAYTMLQERATFFNYDQTRRRIRQEYGLPEKVTPEERKRGLEIGAAGAFRTVSIDEIAHHGFFLELTQIYTKYLPEQMLDELVKVFKSFKMPAIDLIPNSIDLEQAMRRTGIHTPRNQVTHVNNPALDALGFENRRAVEKAAQEAKILPDGLGPQYIGISRTGEFVLSMTSDSTVR